MKKITKLTVLMLILTMIMLVIGVTTVKATTSDPDATIETEEEPIWSDKNKVKLEIKESNSNMNYNLHVTGLTSKNAEGFSITCHVFISNKTAPTVKYDSKGIPEGGIIIGAPNYYTNITPYFEKAGDVYVTLVETQMSSTSSQMISKELLTAHKITRPSLKPLGLRTTGFFFEEDTSVHVNLSEPMAGLDNGAKINVKIGRITDKDILRAIQKNENGALAKLLNYAKKADKLYEGTFDNTQKKQKSITHEFTVVDGAYYYVYMSVGGEFYPIEDVSLYQGMVSPAIGNNLHDYLSDKFKWNIDDEEEPTEPIQPPKPTEPTKPTEPQKPDNTVLPTGKLPQTGQSIALAVIVAVIAIVGVVFAVKAKKYKI